MVPPIIVAHRGFSAEAPENTLVAFQRAVDVGATVAECDVRRTRDGHIVLLHDETLDRTTDGSGPVAERTFAEVRGLDAGSWKSSEYAGESVPTLGETLGATAGKLLLIVEIKAEGITEAVLDILRDRPQDSEVAIVSFSYETCRESRHLAPEIPLAWLGSGGQALHVGYSHLATQGLQGRVQPPGHHVVDIVAGVPHQQGDLRGHPPAEGPGVGIGAIAQVPRRLPHASTTLIGELNAVLVVQNA